MSKSDRPLADTSPDDLDRMGVLLKRATDAEAKHAAAMMVVETSKSEQLISRLCNWKFKQALQYLDGQPELVQLHVKNLVELYEDSGWFDGRVGQLVSLAVAALVGNRHAGF